MTHTKANPSSVGTLDGAGNFDTAGKQVELPYRSETPTRKVKYFGRRDNSARAAIRMVAAAFGEPDCKQLRLVTCPDRPSDPLPEGVSAAEVCFDRAQFDAAIQWTTGCLTSGWIIFRRECRT
jgi:hypothetical protein